MLNVRPCRAADFPRVKWVAKRKHPPSHYGSCPQRVGQCCIFSSANAANVARQARQFFIAEAGEPPGIEIERSAPGGQAGSSPKIENYLGFPTGISGDDLTRRAVSQAKRFGVEIMSAQEAKQVFVRDTYRIVKLSDGTEISCHALLIATGASFHTLKMPGAAELTGAGIYYGAAYTEAMN